MTSPSRRHLIVTALRRGSSRRCPHCGQGALFRRGEHLPRCEVCGLVYERNQGDTWFFTIIGDRVPIAIMVAAVYFGIGQTHPILMVIAFCVMGVLIFWTAPSRWGMGIALHYLSRIFWPDPSDPIPSSYE
jgi:uncharacterized protein (DUF983 family)